MPNLTTVSIQHYRGFYEPQVIALAGPRGAPGSGLTVLVGPNNSGKSTLVSAIRMVSRNDPQQIDVEHRHTDHLVEIAVTDEAGRQKSLTNPDRGSVTVIGGDPQTFPTARDLRVVPARRAWSPYAGQAQIDANNYWAQQRQAVLPAEDPYLVSRFAGLSPEEKVAFQNLMTELLPQLRSWKIELSRGQSFLQYETHTGARHAADLFGDGTVSLFRVGLTLHDSRPDDLVLIDEPELSLHPQAQKALASLLARFASDRQILITTHSPHFVRWADIVNGAKVWRLTQEANGIAVGNLSDETVNEIERLITDWQKPHLLDAVAKEIFFADEVIFFEGQEDVSLVRKFCEDRDLPPISAFGYGAGGFGNIQHLLRVAKELRIPSAAVFDGEHREAMEEAQKQFPDALIESLPTPDIRDKFKVSGEIEKEGLFDHNGTIKSEHEKYLAALLERVRRSLAGADV